MRPIETLTAIAFALGAVSAADLHVRAPIDTPVGDKGVIPLTHKRPAPLKLRTPAYDESCNAAQVKALNKYFTQALKLLDTILDPKVTTVDSAQYEVFFDAHRDPTRFKNVMGIYKTMKKTLTATDRAGLKDLVVSCGTPKKASDCDGATAFALSRDHKIHFCGNFFGGFLSYVHEKATSLPQFEQFKCKKVKGTDTLEFDLKAAHIDPLDIDNLYFMPVTTVIHEMSHLYKYPGATDTVVDCVYGAYGGEYIARTMQDAAVGNADNYAWFGITQYIQSFCNDNAAEEAYYLRSVEDKKAVILSESFQHQWAAFNAKLAKLHAVKAELKKPQEEQVAASAKLFDFKQKLRKKTPTPAEEKHLADLQKELDDVQATLVTIGKKMNDLNFQSQYQIQVCDTKKTVWSAITKDMAMASKKNKNGRNILPSGRQDHDEPREEGEPVE